MNRQSWPRAWRWLGLLLCMLVGACGAAAEDPTSAAAGTPVVAPFIQGSGPLHDTIIGIPGQVHEHPATRATGLVKGRITDVDGSPLWEVGVDVESLDEPPQPLNDIAIASDTEGHYAWELQPGLYRLTFTLWSYHTVARVVRVRQNTITVEDVQLRSASEELGP